MFTDEELLKHAPGLPHLYFDGYGAYRKINGVLRCVAFTVDGPQYNIITSLAGADQANKDTRRALDAKTANPVLMLGGRALRTH